MKLYTYVNYLLIFFSIILNCSNSAQIIKKQSLDSMIHKNSTYIKFQVQEKNNKMPSIIKELNKHINLTTSNESEEIVRNNFNSTAYLDAYLSSLDNIEQQKISVNNNNNIKIYEDNNINGSEHKSLLNDLNKNNNINNYKTNGHGKKMKYFETLMNIRKFKDQLNEKIINSKKGDNVNRNFINNNIKNIVVTNEPGKSELFTKDNSSREWNLKSNDSNKITEGNIQDEILFEEFLKQKIPKKKKYMDDDNVFMFYNSLSLIMLSMLGGGVVGVIFILYFSFKNDNSNLNS